MATLKELSDRLNQSLTSINQTAPELKLPTQTRLDLNNNNLTGSGAFSRAFAQTTRVAKSLDPANISIDIDPNTNRIRVKAPDYVLSSPQFPQFIQQLDSSFSGAPVQSPDLLARLSEARDLVAQYATEVRPLDIARKEYVNRYTGSTSQDADNYLASYNTNPTDRESNIVTGFDSNGKPIVETVGTLLDYFNNSDETSRASRVQEYYKLLESQNIPESQKAHYRGLVDFINKNANLGAGIGTQVGAGLTSFDQQLQDSAVQSILEKVATAPQSLLDTIKSRYPDLPSPVLDVLNTYLGQPTGPTSFRTRTELTPEQQYLNTTTSKAVGSLAGSLGAIGIDAIAAGAIASATAGAALPYLSALGTAGSGVLKGDKTLAALPYLSALGTAGSGVLKGDKTLAALQSAGRVGKTIFTAVDLGPSLAFGGLQATDKALNQEEYDFASNFLQDLATNAVLYGAGKSIPSVARFTANTKVGSKVSDSISQGITKAFLTLSDMPGIRLGQKLYHETVDDLNSVRRAVAKQFADSGDSALKYANNNIINDWATQGGGQGVEFVERTGNDVINIAQGLDDTTRSNISSYLSDKRIIQVMDSLDSQGSLSKVEQKTLQKYKDRFSEVSKELGDNVATAEDIYNRLAGPDGYYTKAVDLQQADGLGPRNLDELRASEGYGNYLYRQADMTDLATRKTRQGKSGNRKVIQDIDPNTRNTFKFVDKPSDFLENMYKFANDTFAMKANNNFRIMLSDLVDNGYLKGKLVKDRTASELFQSLDQTNILKNKTIKDSIDNVLNKAFKNVGDKYDDIANVTGQSEAAQLLEKDISTAIDDIVDTIAKSPDLAKEFSDLGIDPREGAIALLNRESTRNSLFGAKGAFVESLSQSITDKNTAQEMTKIARNRLKELIDSTPETSFAKDINNSFDEVSRLAKEFNVKPKDGEKLFKFRFPGGADGEVILADPGLLDALAIYSTPVSNNLINTISTTATRLYRNFVTNQPVFQLTRNLPRDTISSFVFGNATSTIKSALDEVAKATGIPRGQVDDLFRRIAPKLEGATFTSAIKPAGYSAKEILIRNADGTNKIIKLAEGLTTKEGASIALNTLDNALQSVELYSKNRVLTNRLADALKRGQTQEQAIEEALYFANNANTYFRNVGASMRGIVKNVPFLNAALQGNASALRMFAADPLGVFMRMTAGVAIPSLMLTSHNLSNDDTKAVYANIPDYIKDNNLVYVIGNKQDDYITIPLPQEVAKFIKPWRRLVETTNDVDPDSFQSIFVSGMLGAMPIDISPVVEKDITGQTDPARGVTQIVNVVLPQVVKTGYEAITGKSLYTGNLLGPNKEELLARGLDANPEDITYNSKDSAILRRISSFSGIPQDRLQSVIRNTTGTVGGYVLNGLDRLLGNGGPLGGESILDDLSNNLTGSDSGFTQINEAYYGGLDRMSSARDRVMARAENINKEYPFASDQDKQRLKNEYDTLVDDYYKELGDFYSRLDSASRVAGGLEDYQKRRISNLFDLGSATTDPSSPEGQIQSNVGLTQDSTGRLGAFQQGLPILNDAALYGTVNDTGGLDFNNLGDIDNLLNRSRFQLPSQIESEINTLVSGTNAPLKELDNKYDKLFTQAYDVARATGNYDEVDKLTSEYNNEFVKVLSPLAQKYGPSILLNSKTLDQIDRFIKVPGDYTRDTRGRYLSSARNPNLNKQEGFAKNFIRDLFGIGNNVSTNLPSDQEVKDKIQQINVDLANGKFNRANSTLRDLYGRIDNGQLYADRQDILTINKLKGEF